MDSGFVNASCKSAVAWIKKKWLIFFYGHGEWATVFKLNCGNNQWKKMIRYNNKKRDMNLKHSLVTES